jgi:glutamine synthetase
MNQDVLQKWMEDRGITEVECMVPDLTGVARGKILPAKKFFRESMRLPEGIFIQTVTGDWPDDDDSLVNPTVIDMELRPDPKTVCLVPWAAEPTAQVIHDCFYRDGSPVDLSPRAVLKKILKQYELQGWSPVLAPEVEFYLVKKNTDSDYPLEPPIGRSGRQETARRSYGIDAVNEFDPLFEEMYDYCEAMELEIDTLIHEEGAGQMEVNFLHGNPLDLADQVFLFKRAMREVALRHGIYATFMAKPMANEAGSAMHVHQSILDLATGQNIFSTPEGEPSELFFHFIGGLQKYLPAAMSLMAPNVNSYRRIARFGAAPINVQWGYDNRTVGLRVPHSSPANRRIENRIIGADCNPYLAFAASLAAGYLGMVKKIKPSDPLSVSAYDLPYQLPRNLLDALALLRQSEDLQHVLGERFVRAYTAVKEKEYETFFAVISSWERDFLLLNV